MNTTGSCFCGAIEYAAEIDPRRIAVCHCRDCQIISGSAFRMTAPIDPSRFRIIRGAPTSFEKTADSGNIRRMIFCGQCGTHIASMPQDPNAPGAFIGLRISTSKDFASLRPSAEVWCQSRVPWLPGLDCQASFDAQP